MDLFHGYSEAKLDSMAAVMGRCSFRAGEPIVTQGRTGLKRYKDSYDGIFFILKGEVRCLPCPGLALAGARPPPGVRIEYDSAFRFCGGKPCSHPRALLVSGQVAVFKAVEPRKMKPKKNDFMERLSSPNSALATPPVETITLPSQAPNARGAFYDAAGNLLTYSQFKDIKDQECADRRGAMAKKKEEDK